MNATVEKKRFRRIFSGNLLIWNHKRCIKTGFPGVQSQNGAAGQGFRGESKP